MGRAADDIADFRSDTLTHPTAAMREAMAAAEVGDDVFEEDPTIRALEAEAAAWLGKEAALFVPSGTMANQVAIHVHCRPGDELLCEERSHVFYYEGGSIARLSGTQARTFRSPNGFPDPTMLAKLVRGQDVHYPHSRLLVLENTHNMAGGRVLTPAAVAGLTAEAHRLGLAVHVDGARLANAAVACAVSAPELLAGVDSVSLCFSKALGAPVGSVVAGSQEFVAQARLVRKAFGGGMRQGGVIAAAARLALRDGPDHLPIDHQRARSMAQALAGLPGVGLRPAEVETNILMLELGDEKGEDLLAHLSRRGVRVLAAPEGRVRFVFHRDLCDEHVARGIAAVQEWAEQASNP